MLGAVLAGFMLLSATGGEALTSDFKSKVRITELKDFKFGGGHHRYIAGVVKSEKRRCRLDRSIKIEARIGGGWFDPGWKETTGESRRGKWEFESGMNGFIGASKIRATVKRKRLANGSLCLPDTTTVRTQ